MRSETKFSDKGMKRTHTSILSKNKARAKTKLMISSITLATNIVLKIGSDIMTHFINKTNEATKVIMESERDMNLQTLANMKSREIETCATVKLIIATNKQFFLLTNFKTIILEMKSLKLRNIKKYVEEKPDTPLIDIKALDKYTELFNNIESIKSKIDGFEADLLNSLKDIEDDICNQDVNYSELQERNEELETKITRMEKLLDEKEESFLGSLFTGGWVAIKKLKYFKEHGVDRIEDSADFHEVSNMMNDEFGGNAFEDLKASQSSEMTKLDGDPGVNRDWNDQQIHGSVSKFAAILTRLIDVKEAWTKYNLEENANKKTQGKFMILAKAFTLLASILNAIQTVIPPVTELAVITGIIGAVLELVAKLIEVCIAGYNYYKITKEDPDYLAVKDIFYKALSDFGVAIVALVFSGFSVLAAEGFTFFRKISDLVSAYRRKKQQTLEMNLYKNLGEMKIKDQNNIINFKLCLANFLSMKSQFETLIELNKGDQHLENMMSSARKSKESSTQDGNARKSNESSTKDGNAFDKKSITSFRRNFRKICEKNIQFCTRNFSKEFFENFDFSSREINEYIELSNNGPFTDFVVTNDIDTGISFIKLGYEPIGENIYGCRKCSLNYIIRHVDYVSDDALGRLKKEGLLLGVEENDSICGTFYQDNNCSSSDSYSNFKSIRLDSYYSLIYEVVSLQDTQLALNKMLYTNRKNPLKPTEWIPFIQVHLSAWNPKNISWEPCSQANICKEYDTNKYWIKVGDIPSIGEKDVILIVYQNQQSNISQTNQTNRLLLPIGGPSDVLLTDKSVIIDQPTYTTPLAYLVSEPSNGRPRRSEISVDYKQDMGEGIQTHKFSLSHTRLSPTFTNGKYNWLFKDEPVEDKQNVGQFIKLKYYLRDNLKDVFRNLDIIPINIRRESVVEPDAEVEDSNIKYLLVKFDSFLPDKSSNQNTINSKIQEVRQTVDCDQVCDNSQTTNVCATENMSFNKWWQLEADNSFPNSQFNLNTNIVDNNYEVIEIKNVWHKPPIDPPPDSVYTESLKTSSEKINFDFDDRNKKIFIRTISLENVTRNIKERKSLYLTIEKKFIKFNDRSKDTLELKIQDALEAKSFTLKNDTEKNNFIIRLSDIDSTVYLMALTNDKEVKKYLNNFLQAFPGYIIIDRTFVMQNNFANQRFIVLLVKPLPSSGFLQTKDYSDSKWHSTHRECENSIDRNISDNFAIKDFKGRVEAETFVLKNLKTNTFNYEKIDFYFDDFTSTNLTSAVLKKLFPDSIINRTIHPLTLFLANPEINLFARCSKFTFLYPFIFKRTQEEKDKKLYRTLEIDPNDNNAIKMVLTDKGPGIKSIFWLEISSHKSINKYSANNMQAANTWGFSFFKEVQWKLSTEKSLFVRIFVKYDFRIKIDKEYICELCLKVNFFEEMKVLSNRRKKKISQIIYDTVNAVSKKSRNDGPGFDMNNNRKLR